MQDWSKSLRTSLLWIKQEKSGLDNKRNNLLNRVPQPNDWAKFNHKSIKVKDLAYLTAASGDEFALLRGKRIAWRNVALAFEISLQTDAGLPAMPDR